MIKLPRWSKVDVAGHINQKQVTSSKLATAFGLGRQNKIIKSGVRETFTPNHPIKEVDSLLGREAEIERVYEAINTPGRHVLVYGDRGVGKSSLAYVMTLLSGELYQVIFKRCDSQTKFIDLVAEPLRQLKNIDVNVRETHQHSNVEAEGHVGFGSVGIEVSKGNGESRTMNGYHSMANSPSWVASQIASSRVLLVIDELDSIQGDQDRKQLAELLKLVSDHPVSNFKFLLVGIAKTASELTAGHLSVQRCLIEVPLRRLLDSDLIKILERGEDKHALRFTDDAKVEIARLSHGYPYFTHLIALKAAENAVADDRTQIDLSHVEGARRQAVSDADGTLRNAYQAALVGDTNDRYRKLLQAAALYSNDVITAAQLKQSYKDRFGEEINISSYMQRLVSEDGTLVFRRIAPDRAVYQFSDPRMPSYIRLAQGAHES